jgi:hypothetical protein
MRRYLALACFPLSAFGLAQAERVLHAYAKLSSPKISEMSGLIKSRSYSDLYWVHNDSGDSARIFAIHADGSMAGLSDGVSIQGAINHDWEDIAIDGDTLYISDLGNNGNARKNLSVYEVPEPNPRSTASSRARRFAVAFPDQREFPPNEFRNFDCEAIFVLRHTIYLITKERLGAHIPSTTATLYRLDHPREGIVNYPVRIEQGSLGGWVTAADISPDGKTLAVLTHFPQQSVWLFDTSAKGDRFLSRGHGRQIKFTGALQCEALCFDSNSEVMIGNEQGDLFRLSIK